MLFLGASELWHLRGRLPPLWALPCPGRRHRAEGQPGPALGSTCSPCPATFHRGLAGLWGWDSREPGQGRLPPVGDPNLQHMASVPGDLQAEVLTRGHYGALRRKAGWGLTLTPGRLPESDMRPHLRGPEVYSFLRRSWGQRNPDSKSGFALCPQGVVLETLKPLGPALGQLSKPEAKEKFSDPALPCLYVRHFYFVDFSISSFFKSSHESVCLDAEFWCPIR